MSVIENKISAIKKYMNIASYYKKFSETEILNDISLKGAVERYLYLVIQATIELAEAVIAFKSFRKPTTYGETFDILFEEKYISSVLREKLIKMAGFRNVLTHDYEKVNFEIVYAIMKHRLIDVKQFIKRIQIKLRLH